MKRRNLGWLSLGSVLSSSAWADMQLNLTKGVTEVSRDVYDLHMLAMYICVAIGVVVFGAMFWSMVFHRKSKGAKSDEYGACRIIEIPASERKDFISLVTLGRALSWIIFMFFAPIFGLKRSIAVWIGIKQFST